MAAQERQEARDQEVLNPRELIQAEAPWLLDAELGVCIVGSKALAEACLRAGIDGPRTQDLDLSWALDTDTGRALLESKGVFRKTTAGNLERGTLAFKLAESRIEITTFRGDDVHASIEQRILADLQARDMTVGGLAWWLAEDRILDPTGGLDDWHNQRVVPIGDPAERIREHPARWLRYYRRAQEWGFEMDIRIRKVDVSPEVLREVPPEALAGEVRAALLHCASPGRFLAELHEKGLLAIFAEELSRQFDGRPAGPLRHHPEVSQALHLILALEWLQQRAQRLSTPDHLAVAVAVLCHDIGKGYTEDDILPSHHGHEESGVEPIRALLDRLPGLADARARRLVEAVAVLHTTARGIENLRPGTRARLYERWFKQNDFPVELFALALGADSGGRLDLEQEGERIRDKVLHDVEWIRTQCATVDAGKLWQEFGSDKERFQSELHQAYARVLN